MSLYVFFLLSLPPPPRPEVSCFSAWSRKTKGCLDHSSKKTDCMHQSVTYKKEQEAVLAALSASTKAK